MEFISKKKDFIINEINSDLNHIHILISYNPNLSISSIVRCLKQENTYFLWKKYNFYFFILKYYYNNLVFITIITFIINSMLNEKIKNNGE